MLALLADLLTLSRVAATGILVWLGITRGAAALPFAALVIAAAWTTDQLDGFVARRSSTPTRLGRYDFPIDVTFYAGILAFFVLAGLAPLWPAAIFVAVGIVAWFISRRKAVGVLFLRIVDVTGGIILLRRAPLIGCAILGWLAVVGILYRRRLAERVPRWAAELRDLARGHG